MISNNYDDSKSNLGPFDGWIFNDKAKKHTSVSNISNNDKTVASTHMNSEYGALQIQDRYVINAKYPKRSQLNHSNTHHQGYSLINQWYSDNSSINISGLPNANSSAIVIWSPTNNQAIDINELINRRVSAQDRDTTPDRNVLKLLNSNSSWRSISNGQNTKSKTHENKNKGLRKKKMKLRNLINHNLYNHKKGKYPKLGDIGLGLFNGKRKKSHLNSSKHQNSEYIDIQNNLSGIQNKENINSSNVNNSKSLNSQIKPKKSLSRIKSNYFHQNIGPDIKTSSSNANLRKTSTRKRRNVNSSANLKNKTKNITSSAYYTHRDKEGSKRGIDNAKMLTEIAENRYKRSECSNEIAKKQWESTKVSHRNKLKNSKIEWVKK